MTNNSLQDRKLQHINIVKDEKVEPLPSFFDHIQLPYKALPEINMHDIDTSITFANKKLSMPFIISSMTGGEQNGRLINENLAIAAEEMQVALGLGSMRITLVKPESLHSFDIRKYCPTIPLFANIGLVQLNYGFGVEEINKIIDSIHADGIFLHINPLQEAIQPEGDTNFSNLIEKLEKIINKINGTVIIKEVGNGIDYQTALSLKQIGVKWIDVSGLGGTSWPWVEGYRRGDNLGELFSKVGIPTPEALQKLSKIDSLNLIAGGGIRSGLDIAKSIMLGAQLATAAKPLLEAALSNESECISFLKKTMHELKIAMFITGCKNIGELSNLQKSI
jgi:isopentenyl-diphosphate Delta-isomerase